MPCRIIERPSSDLREKKLQREADERKRVMQEAQARERELINSRRLAALEQQAEAFGIGVRRAQEAQRQQQVLQNHQQLIDALHAHNHPPQPQEPTVIYVEQSEADGLMYNDLLHRRW